MNPVRLCFYFEACLNEDDQAYRREEIFKQLFKGGLAG